MTVVRLTFSKIPVNMTLPLSMEVLQVKQTVVTQNGT